MFFTLTARRAAWYFNSARWKTWPGVLNFIHKTWPTWRRRTAICEASQPLHSLRRLISYEQQGIFSVLWSVEGQTHLGCCVCLQRCWKRSARWLAASGTVRGYVVWSRASVGRSSGLGFVSALPLSLIIPHNMEEELLSHFWHVWTHSAFEWAHPQFRTHTITKVPYYRKWDSLSFWLYNTRNSPHSKTVQSDEPLGLLQSWCRHVVGGACWGLQDLTKQCTLGFLVS